MQSFGSHENVTVNVSGDSITKTYDPEDTVAVVGAIDQVEDNEDVTLKFRDPSGSLDTETIEEEDDGYFDFAYDIPSNADDGVWEVEAEYSNDKMYTYFIVDDKSDTVNIELDASNGIYEADDEVTISGDVEDLDSGVDEVEVTVLDPTNFEIVDQENVPLGEGNLGEDEFEFSFNLDNDATHGRYAVIVTYDSNNQEGSTLFEILDEDSGSSGGNGDSDSDGDLSAEIEEATYEPGDTVSLSGTIDTYDSGDNQELAIVVEDPNDEEVDDYGDDDVSVQSDGDFDYDIDLAEDADDGTYKVTISYINDEVRLEFEVESSGGGSTGSSDLTVKLNKPSYLAGETMTVTGTVADVADPDDEEVVSILLYKPDGRVILESSKYVTPSSSGAYSATILLDSDLEKDEDYEVIVSYLEDEVRVNFDITGVSSTPSDQIVVQTDKDKYNLGSTVKISGEVPDALIVSGEQLLIRVNTPDGNPCRLDPIDLPSSGSYTYSLVLGGKCGVGGNYKVEVTYNGLKDSTTFELIGASASAYNLAAGGKTYSIEYDLTGGSIKSIFPRPSEDKLVITIDAQEDGQLTIVLPREVIDAIEDGDDISYIVTTEDESGDVVTVDVEESQSTDKERTLVIDYKAGTDRIEIAGTQVVPEFGTLGLTILTVAIVGIIVVTARNGNKFNIFRR
jgi:predicted secreted protein with PEFG-CTERM motif